MIGKGRTVLLTASLLCACQPAEERDGPAPAWEPPSAVVATDARFVNEEYGVSAVFPVGSRVCAALSGDHPHGFYTRLGDDRMPCVPSSDPPKVSSLIIWADYNAAERSVEELSGQLCPDRAPVVVDGAPLALPGQASVSCETRRGEDVEISVSAFVGSELVRDGGPTWDGVKAVPMRIYTARLLTTVDRAAGDKVVFKRFLEGIVLTAPDGEAQ